VAITRKRVKQSLERTLCTPCPYCEGAGYVKSPQTVVSEILQEAHKIARSVEGKDVMLRVSPEVAKLLKSNQTAYLRNWKRFWPDRNRQDRRAAPPGEIRPGVACGADWQSAADCQSASLLFLGKKGKKGKKGTDAFSPSHIRENASVPLFPISSAS